LKKGATGAETETVPESASSVILPLSEDDYSVPYEMKDQHQGKTRNELECRPMPNVMAAVPNIGGALCKSSVIPLLVPYRKLRMTPTAQVPCNNTVNIGEWKTWTQVNFAPGKIPLGGKSPKKCIYSMPAQEMAKHRAKFG